MKNNFGVIILAGGNSERMNYPKPYLIYKKKSFLQHITESYWNADVRNIAIVLNKKFYSVSWQKLIYPVEALATVIENSNPELGRFHSIKLGVTVMSEFDYCFIQNVDNPLISSETIKKIIAEKNSQGYTSPVFNGKGGHPVLISKKVMEKIDRMESKDISVNFFLQRFPKKEVEISNGEVLININTKEDYEKYIPEKEVA